MSYPIARLALPLLLSLGLLSGCGGGGGGGGTTTNTPSSVTVTGSVTKGAIGNASIDIYSLGSDGSRGNHVAGPFSSDASGAWSGSVPATAVGPFEVVATGGSYTDEATGTVVSLALGEELTSLIQSNPGTPISTAVTPYSDALTRSARHMVQNGGVGIGDAVSQVVSNATTTFGFDPTTTVPPDPNNVPAGASDAERRYAALLGGISRLGNEAMTNHAANAGSRLELALALAQDMADGTLDGLGIDGNPIPFTDTSGNSANLPVLDNGGLGALLTETNAFIGTQTNLTGTDVGTLPGDLLIPPPPTITLQTPANGATLAQATQQGSVNLTLAVALSNYRLLNGRSWQLLIDGQPNAQFTTLSGNVSTPLSVGQHTLSVRLNDPTGTPLNPEVSASATITVTQWTDVDSVAPVVTPPSNILVAAAPGATSVAASQSDIATFLTSATASDDRDGDLSGNISHNAPTSFPVGETTVTFSASDSAGNSASASAKVVVTPTTLSFYAVKTIVSGLVSGSVTWELWVDSSFNNDGMNGNGSFQAAASLADGSNYQLTITNKPSDHNCTLTNASGVVTGANVTITISCAEIPPVAPARFDLSGLSFTPSEPTLSPAAPSATPIDGSNQIAALYAEFVANERARIFAPAPSGITTQVVDSVTPSNGSYKLMQMAGGANEWQRTLYMRFGPDGEMFTADDQMEGYGVAPNGFAGPMFGFVHPGPDSIWFTPDDMGGSDYYGKAVYLPSGVSYEYSGTQGAVLIITALEPGADGQIFTADDTPGTGGYQLALIDGQGHRGQVINYNGSGSDGLWFTADDTPNLYSLVTFDANGNLAQTTTYNAKGGDGLWFTADDTVQLYIVSTVNATSKMQYAATFNNKGGDGLWFTADDNLSAYSYYGYDGNGLQLLLATHTSKGADGTWFTADDSASALVTLQDANGNTQIQANLTGMGADGIWLTGDETMSFYSYMEYDAAGRQTRSASFNAAGADGKWLTADDVPNTYNFWQKEFDASGNLLSQINYSGAGADGQAFTADDTATNYTVYRYDANGTRTAYISINDMGADGLPMTADDASTYQLQIGRDNGSIYSTGSPGADGIWFTADDPRTGYFTLVKGAGAGVLQERRNYDGPGPDGVWDTQDDQLSSYSTAVSTDAFGSFHFVGYSGPGADGVWFTADDVVSNYSDNRVDGNGNLNKRTQYYEAGVDGVWFTADDPVSSIEYMAYDVNGKMIYSAAAYNSGSDGIWGTVDDFNYYAGYTYTANGELASTISYNGAGVDGVWFTADDQVQSISYNAPVVYDPTQTAANTGSTMAACNAASTASGAIGVLVVDQEGAALPGVTAQLDQAGATVTTDASGFAEFPAITGVHDLHLFKDGYSWESFYCVEPANGLVVQSQLSSTTTAAVSSSIKLSLTTTNLGSGRVVELRLLDTQGNEIARNKDLLLYGNNVDLNVPMAAGSSLTGNLWAFEMGWYGSTYKVFDAVLVGGAAQTFTTVDNASTTRTPVDVTFALTDPTRLWLSNSQQIIRPTGYFGNLALSLNGLIDLPFIYESSQGGSYASMPDTLNGIFSATGVSVLQGSNNDTGATWSVFKPVTQGGNGLIDANFASGVLFGPAFGNQQTLADANPQFSWTPLRLTTPGSHGGYTRVDLVTYVSGITQSIPLWSIHLPAGAQSLTLPSRPAGLVTDHLSRSSFQLGMQVVALEGMDYQTLISTRDLHDPLANNLSRETFTLPAVGRFLTR